jgi:hypothetical protein
MAVVKKTMRKTSNKKTKRGYNRQTNAKAVKSSGNIFKSGLELEMNDELVAAGIKFSYEGQKFTIDEGFKYTGISFEKFMNGKGDFKDRGKKTFRDAIYTPDFTNPVAEDLQWVIETKGRVMPDFSRTWRLFKKQMSSLEQEVLLFVPRNKKDCKKVIEILIQEGYGQE